MSRVSSAIAAGLKSLQADLDHPTISIGGQTFNIVPGSTDISKVMGLGGWSPDVGMRFIVLSSDLPDATAYLRETLTVDATGEVYRLDSFKLSPCGAYTILSCSDKDQGV